MQQKKKFLKTVYDELVKADNNNKIDEIEKNVPHDDKYLTILYSKI